MGPNSLAGNILRSAFSVALIDFLGRASVAIAPKTRLVLVCFSEATKKGKLNIPCQGFS